MSEPLEPTPVMVQLAYEIGCAEVFGEPTGDGIRWVWSNNANIIQDVDALVRKLIDAGHAQRGTTVINGLHELVLTAAGQDWTREHIHILNWPSIREVFAQPGLTHPENPLDAHCRTNNEVTR